MLSHLLAQTQDSEPGTPKNLISSDTTSLCRFGQVPGSLPPISPGWEMESSFSSGQCFKGCKAPHCRKGEASGIITEV